MARVNRIASNKPKLDMVLLCIRSQFGLVTFDWELSGLVWFAIIWLGGDQFVFFMVEFGLVWVSAVWYGWFWFFVVQFSLVWCILIFVWFGKRPG